MAQNNQQQNEQNSYPQGVPVQPYPQQYTNSMPLQQNPYQQMSNVPQQSNSFGNPYQQMVPQPLQRVPQPQYTNNPNPYQQQSQPMLGQQQYYQPNGMAQRQQQIEQLKLMEINRIVPGQRGNSWSGLLIRPGGVRFINQNSDEYVFVIVRSHWTANVGWMIRNFFYSFVPPLLVILFNIANLEVEFLNIRTSIILALSFYSILLTNIVRDFFDWYFDPYIVTNQRIVHYSYKPFSSYTIKEAELGNIEDIKEKSAGIFAGIFDYGTIIVTTASNQTRFVFEKIPSATLVRDIISDLKRIDRKYHGRA